MSLRRMASRLGTSLGLVLGLASVSLPAGAQTFVVVPPSREFSAGDSSNTIPAGANDGTFQVLYPATQLASIPIGSRITSMQMRMRSVN